MAKAKVVHSDDACTIVFEGDRRNPEPTMGAIRFPGGSVEVSRTSDGNYWAHISFNRPEQSDDGGGRIIDSRIDYDHEGYTKARERGLPSIPSVPMAEHMQHIAVLIGRAK